MDDYWQEQLGKFGRNTLFVDTWAILEYFNPEDEWVSSFLNEELVGDRLVTSTYVVAEVVRRLVKSRHLGQFVGPGGERAGFLARYVVNSWLQEFNVAVICVPAEIFRAARERFSELEGITCDLTDVLSLLIVEGLQQTRILSGDQHFARLGLNRLP